MSNEQSKPAGWPTDDMVVRGAEELHDSLRMFGIDINFDTKTKGTEIQQEIVEAVFKAMLAAAPKAVQSPVQEPVAWLVSGGDGRPKTYEQYPEWAVGDAVLVISPLYAAPQPVSDDAMDALVEAISEVVDCFDAAETEGWGAAVQSGDFDSIRDLWHRRISFAYFAASEALAAYRAAMGEKHE